MKKLLFLGLIGAALLPQKAFGSSEFSYAECGSTLSFLRMNAKKILNLTYDEIMSDSSNNTTLKDGLSSSLKRALDHYETLHQPMITPDQEQKENTFIAQAVCDFLESKRQI